METLNAFEDRVLSRDVSALHVFSDTQNARGARDARDPRFADFDAPITTDLRSLRLDTDTRDSIARNPDLGAYGAETITALQDHAAGLIETIERYGRVTQNIRRAKDTIYNRTRQIVVNDAPRNRDRIVRTNGNDFLLGITYNGIEIYCTPIELLKFARRDIVSLFRIPNENHPLFDGKKEQFRSSVIALSRNFPDHLVPIYRYETREELIDAIERGAETTIPEQEHDFQKAFADRYGNARVRAKRSGQVEDLIQSRINRSGVVGLLPHGQAERKPIPAYLTSCLDDIPENQIGIYRNVADGEGNPHKPGYFEVARKFPDGGGEEEVEFDAFTTLGKRIGQPIQIVRI
ncbi:MAG: hypothetical protein Q7R81_07000 [Candidatus Peregrinibacteria bacterium]|nr:hypothetical protein [Candidatus Peregrinibacteria bacterium]